MTFRKTIFWLHLAAGVICGLVIGVMCFTGTLLAFEKEIIAWSERDVRRVEPSTGASTRLSLDELQRHFREAQPAARPANIVFQNDPAAAVTFSAGRAESFHVDPYTGEVRQPKSPAVAGFMQKVTAWHRYLGFTGENSRPRAKWINGACSLAFCVLAITGLYLWMPRSWSWRAIRPVIWFQGYSGKARDFNWHNTIGFWSAPVLIVLTLTAIPISFQWGGRLINQLTGTPQPANSTGPAGARGAVPTVEVPQPAPGARPVNQDVLLTRVQREILRWKTITLRTSARSATPPAAMFTVREQGTWPRTATTTLWIDPYTGEILRRTGFADQNAARQVRGWTRFLHTGEALGPIGQFIAGLACLGGCFLVYTGLALSWRRFFGKPGQSAAEPGNQN